MHTIKKPFLPDSAKQAFINIASNSGAFCASALVRLSFYEKDFPGLQYHAQLAANKGTPEGEKALAFARELGIDL